MPMWDLTGLLLFWSLLFDSFMVGSQKGLSGRSQENFSACVPSLPVEI